MAGNLASTKDLKETITQDMTRVNILSIAFVFVILMFNFKSILLPVILTIVIEASIWINLTVPYFTDETMFYIGYLIISSVQLGATIDYGILFTDRYIENSSPSNGTKLYDVNSDICIDSGGLWDSSWKGFNKRSIKPAWKLIRTRSSLIIYLGYLCTSRIINGI